MTAVPIVRGIPADTRHIEAAHDAAWQGRRDASNYAQAGLAELARFHRENAAAAERWLVEASRKAVTDRKFLSKCVQDQ